MDLGAIDISAAGMRVQRARMDLIAANIANAGSAVEVDAPGAEPCRRNVATVLEGPRGLPIVRVTEAGTPVNTLTEMVDLIAASRAYEANLAAVEVAKSINQSTLRILG